MLVPHPGLPLIFSEIPDTGRHRLPDGRGALTHSYTIRACLSRRSSSPLPPSLAIAASPSPSHPCLQSLIYGEVDFTSFYRILRKVNPLPGTIFYDLGSGTGKHTYSLLLVLCLYALSVKVISCAKA